MRGKWFILAASVVLVALVAVGAAMLKRVSASRAKPSVASAPTQLVLPDIHLSGKIRAQQVVGVPPPLEGTVAAFYADVGQDVFEGQLLARIANEGLETGQQAAQRDAEAAQTRVNSMESEITSARLEASRARADAHRARGEYDRLDKLFRRQQMLFREGATPKLAFEKASRDFDVARSELHTVEQVASNADARVADLVRTLDAEKRAMQEKTDALENAQARAGATEVLSPAQGIVVARKGQVGQPVTLDQGDFFQIATQLSLLEVALDPDPLSMRRIQLGFPAIVSLPDQGVDGITGVVKAIQGEQVIVDFTSPNPAVKPGMTALVTIRAAEDSPTH